MVDGWYLISQLTISLIKYLSHNLPSHVISCRNHVSLLLWNHLISLQLHKPISHLTSYHLIMSSHNLPSHFISSSTISSQEGSHLIFKSLSSFAEFIVFLYMGEMVDHEMVDGRWDEMGDEMVDGRWDGKLICLTNHLISFHLMWW